MANILYGVSGVGSGHSSRAREISNYLIKNGHKVKILSYGRGFENLNPHFDVEKIFGLIFDQQENKINYFKTVYKNLINSHAALGSIGNILKIIDDFKPDVVFTDFEPLSSLCANIKKLPLISIDNQHRITDTCIEYPDKYNKEALAAKTIINLMVINTKACLVTNFFKTKVKKNNVFVFPPILRNEVLRMSSVDGDYVLVYLTEEITSLINILTTINKRFIVYGFNENKKEKNIIFKKKSVKGFLKDLAGAEAVIANAGYTLITEALYLEKPYLALPVEGQFEQILNAHYLEKSGYGKYWDKLDKEKIESFLYNIDNYKKKLKKYKKTDNTKLFNKIDQLIKKYA